MAKYKQDWLREDYEEVNFQRMKKKSSNPKKKHVKDNKKKNFVENPEVEW